MSGMGMGINREVFRSAPRGPIMGNDVFRSAPLARGAVPVYRGSSDLYRGGRAERWRGNRETFRSALTGPALTPSRMPTSSPATGDAFRGGQKVRSGAGVQPAGRGPVFTDATHGFRSNFGKDNYNLTKEQMATWNAVNNKGTTGDSGQVDEALPQATVPQRQDCLSVDQRQRWLDTRMAAFQRHMDAFKRNEHRMKDDQKTLDEEKKRVKPRLLAEKARLKAEQEDIDDDKKHVPRDPRDIEESRAKYSTAE